MICIRSLIKGKEGVTPNICVINVMESNKMSIAGLGQRGHNGCVSDVVFEWR